MALGNKLGNRGNPGKPGQQTLPLPTRTAKLPFPAFSESVPWVPSAAPFFFPRIRSFAAGREHEVLCPVRERSLG